MRACLSASQSSPVVSATTASAAGPASSTPDSSKVSRTAAQIRARATAAEQSEDLPPFRRVRARPGQLGVRVARVDRPTGKHVGTGRERHRPRAPEQVDVEAASRDRGAAAPRWRRRAAPAGSLLPARISRTRRANSSGSLISVPVTAVRCRPHALAWPCRSP